ncbi:hypothetical protein NKH60_32040 [Mesorhizobium sp. M1006]|uniref:hypothetical protein n=1 Tax=Mesorhizobium sp. M1006 TaxID=2957048 RepID=UPI0033392C13
MVGAQFGLTPRKYQFFDTDVTGRIFKVGEHGVPVVLYEAANVLLTRPVKGSALKSWCACGGEAGRYAQAKVAFARRLAVAAPDAERFLPTGRAAAVVF